MSVDRDGLAPFLRGLAGIGRTRAELELVLWQDRAAPTGNHIRALVIARIAVDDVADAVATGTPALSKALRKAWREEANCVMVIRGCQTYFNHLGMLDILF